MGHFYIPKLHALTHYVNSIKVMGRLNNVNSAVTKVLYKTIIDGSYNKANVDYIFHESVYM
jgi:hypothetical protein